MGIVLRISLGTTHGGVGAERFSARLLTFGFLRRELPRHPLRYFEIGIVAQRETRVADNLAAPAAFVARNFQPLGQEIFLRLRRSITMARSIARSIGHSHWLRQCGSRFGFIRLTRTQSGEHEHKDDGQQGRCSVFTHWVKSGNDLYITCYFVSATSILFWRIWLPG